jgi:hypothetical protein
LPSLVESLKAERKIAAESVRIVLSPAFRYALVAPFPSRLVVEFDEPLIGLHD